ncbi:hypothetical protein RRG08_009086 [Elysia crispata]|uniref:Uncharacterized protein n=1 Tax=Elysia crispata TaxID=231223 RepID=A0AAE1CU32_9GAST|nr:hypothetical protein RRG08_009086 [Elysia crispata]
MWMKEREKYGDPGSVDADLSVSFVWTDPSGQQALLTQGFRDLDLIYAGHWVSTQSGTSSWSTCLLKKNKKR